VGFRQRLRFYEWKKEGKAKQPFLIRRRDRSPIAFAGLWERWVGSASEKPLETFTIITTKANELVVRRRQLVPTSELGEPHGHCRRLLTAGYLPTASDH
jgi:putative SOS response-associated peptidase YedK